MDINTATFYDDLETMPIYNFYKCHEGDLRYIYVSRRGDITEEITSVWDGMFNKYHELTSTSENISYYNLIIEAKWLERRLVYAPLLIELALKTPPNDREKIYKELKGWKIFIKDEKDIEKAFTILSNSETKLKRKQDEIEEYIKRNEKLKSVGISLEKQAVKLQRRLGVTPDIFKDSVLKWLAYFEELEQLSKENGK
jgi:hypothetical protein